MTQLTWGEARDTVLETTELGYTLASLDRLWSVFIYDEWSEGEYAELRWNRLWFRALDLLSYDQMEDELVWTRRGEAEAFAELARARYAEAAEESEHEAPAVHVINIGDDRRWERAYLEQGGAFLERGKFAGSTGALARMNEVRKEHWFR